MEYALWFIDIDDHTYSLQKSFWNFLIFSKSLMDPYLKILILSTNKRVMHNWEVNLIPFKSPLLCASLRIMIIPFSTKRNRNGDNGKPCLIPHKALKKPEWDPLIIIAKEYNSKNHIIQLTINRVIPIYSNRILIKKNLLCHKLWLNKSSL